METSFEQLISPLEVHYWNPCLSEGENPASITAGRIVFINGLYIAWKSYDIYWHFKPVFVAILHLFKAPRRNVAYASNYLFK